ncbi:hypothetical protein AR457_37465 [Streptomyces agglomeratus]|uniref:Uncharacterized protein n=1 Tax=Streptomyces agglomeratus TaxID=285458 RepID=A0A1E5NYU1_9ACTN|nr:hypothetical protein [Streptomyces agglomeratus]OEJ21482.1 hypothetical protein AS594_38690 [Streptomyces agglomeratus]OEJ22916.1 hypothetical protein AR457_37465 [Streptomyces agglomeratus]OEJ36493.1 hypothetical protein BGK72_37960 [Streptomyces agglomeratus]OEJ56490.1 hypothetical protein BGM19_38140 [Streptomyces agglomeratus]
MGYELQAVIAADELLRVASRVVPGARVVPIRQGLSLMPMTDEVFDAVTDGSDGGDLGFWRLPGGFETVLAQWSSAGPVAYVEAEYFGGVGEQRAAVWAGGSLALGPLDTPTRKRFSRAVSPISQALQRLGAQKLLGEDEFEAAGLDRHRNNEDWISSSAP